MSFTSRAPGSPFSGDLVSVAAPRPDNTEKKPTVSGVAALQAAEHFARKAASSATLRAYHADWTPYAGWCEMARFVPAPMAPAMIGAYFASLAESHAPTPICRRLSAIGKMHRFNDLPRIQRIATSRAHCRGCCAPMAARSKKRRR